MLYERRQLPEISYMKHRHDTKNTFLKYDDDILKRSLSPYIFRNKLMNDFLIKLQPLVSMLFDNKNIVKNWKNYIVDKYYYKQSG
jgi:hypothetical protein